MPTRRQVLQTAAVAAIAPYLHAAGDDTLKVGLVGCGGRGTGAAAQALKADKNVKLVALGDAFEDRLSSCLNLLQKDDEVSKKVQVPAGNCFHGFDAYKEVIAASDVVLLCTTPHFRPLHLAAAIAAGKHVFAEKPVAVDGPGVRSVLETCKRAQQKNLSVVSGLCLRYDYGFKEIVKRLHGGAIGDVRVVQANDYRGGRWTKPREPGQTDMEYQMRNWYNMTWLSGDFNVEQHVHFLDVCAWIMKEQYPVKAVGMGGRQVFTGPEYGNIYDHFSIVYEYADGAKMFSNTRHHPRCANDMSAQAIGTAGRADISEKKKGLVLKPTGKPDWVYDGPLNQMYQTEHDELFAAVRAGKPLNNGAYMAKSTLLAIMGRMAAYTGQAITWEMALNSKEDLTPPSYDWKQKLPEPAIAIPGVTRFS